MKNRIIITCIFIFICSQTFSQIIVNNLADAKKVSKETGKLIIIDFVANWCQPCKMMDREYWSNPTSKTTLNNFILVKVDIDLEKGIAGKFGVTSIPNVKIIDANEYLFHEFLGYDNAERTAKEFEGFPPNVSNYYTALNKIEENKDNYISYIKAAIALQNDSETCTAQGKESLLDKSNEFIESGKKIGKKFSSLDESKLLLIELIRQHNNVLAGNSRKAIKSIDESKLDDSNKPLGYFVLFRAYLDRNENEKVKEYFSKLQSTNSEAYIERANSIIKKLNISI